LIRMKVLYILDPKSFIELLHCTMFGKKRR